MGRKTAYVLVAVFFIGVLLGLPLGRMSCPPPVTVTLPSPVPVEAALGEIYRRVDVTLNPDSGFYLIYWLSGTLEITVYSNVPVKVYVMDFDSFGKWMFAGKQRKTIAEQEGRNISLTVKLPHLDYYAIVFHNPADTEAYISEIKIVRTP